MEEEAIQGFEDYLKNKFSLVESTESKDSDIDIDIENYINDKFAKGENENLK